jgi:magnesium chelatase subunit D
LNNVVTQDSTQDSMTAQWQLALTAAALLALDDTSLHGAIIRAPHGVARDAWLVYFFSLLPANTIIKRIPANISDGRLLGGLDLAATLANGKPVAERGVLAECNGGILVVPMAERLPNNTAAKITNVIDQRTVQSERDGFQQAHQSVFRIILLDESEAGEQDDFTISLALADRLAFHIDLTGIPDRLLSETTASLHSLDVIPLSAADVADARQRLANTVHIQVSSEHIKTLVTVAASFGINSLRAPMLALNVAKAIAALNASEMVRDDDLKLAAQLVLSPRAQVLPTMPNEQDEQDQQGESQAPETPPADAADQGKDDKNNKDDKDESQPDQTPDDDNVSTNENRELDEVILAAVAAVIPDVLRRELISQAANRDTQGSQSAGRAGLIQKSAQHGRIIGNMQPRGGQSRTRLNVLATLRAAAPWQRLRGQVVSNSAKPASNRIHVRLEDFRVNRYQSRSKTTTIFTVDASGSSALHRLAEAKGAVELLLADCYIRRDRVAVIAFRGKTAEVLLPPTRSLVRAKRSLAALPGGGGTPLAAGIDLTRTLCDSLQRTGDSVTVVLLTDGRANVTRQGVGDRAQAEADALQAAKHIVRRGVRSIMIDTSPNSNPKAADIARAMQALYLPLPHAGAKTMAAAINDATQSTASKH